MTVNSYKDWEKEITKIDKPHNGFINVIKPSGARVYVMVQNLECLDDKQYRTVQVLYG